MIVRSHDRGLPAPAGGAVVATCGHRVEPARASFCNGQRVGLSRAIYSAIAVPNFYAGIAAGGEQAGCTDLRLAVGLALDQVEICDMVGGIQEVVAIT